MAGRNDEPIYTREMIRPMYDTEEGRDAALLDLLIFFFFIAMVFCGILFA